MFREQTMRIMQIALSRLTDLLGLLLPCLIGCAAVGGYLLVTWALRPVDRLQTAEQMSLQDLSLRLPVVATGDVSDSGDNPWAICRHVSMEEPTIDARSAKSAAIGAPEARADFSRSLIKRLAP
jgi:hypothetical protein